MNNEKTYPSMDRNDIFKSYVIFQFAKPFDNINRSLPNTSLLKINSRASFELIILTRKYQEILINY